MEDNQIDMEKIDFMKNETKKFEGIAKKVRREIVDMLYKAKAPHIGSSLSIVEILVALYFKYLRVVPEDSQNKDRDS